MADSIHCQLLSGKYGCAVTSAGGSGDSEVLDYMNYFLNELGVVTVGKVGVALDRDPTALDAAINEACKLGTTLAESIQINCAYRAQEKEIAERRTFFVKDRGKQRGSVHQYEYWMEKGWM
jgi:hypothetical protein